MGGTAPAGSSRRAGRGATESLLAVAAALLAAGALIGSNARSFAVVAVVAALVSAVVILAPRRPAAAVALAAAPIAIGSGAIARSVPAILAGVLYLGAGLLAWRAGRRARQPPRSGVRRWAGRLGAAVVALLIAMFVVYPVLMTVGFLAKPREEIDERALGLPHERITFRSTDGVRLEGWYVPGRNGAAIVLVHGGGGDRQGPTGHARMLVAEGYGVLLYDARGRGESAGHQIAAGWGWDLDIRGAVDYLERRGVDRVGVLGLSTGAEAAVTAAASDPRIRAVVADGVQARTPADVSHAAGAAPMVLVPAFLLNSGLTRLVTGERPPDPLDEVVERAADRARVLLIATIPLERDVGASLVENTRAQLWELPDAGHTKGLAEEPAEYRRRTLAVFDPVLVPGRR